MMTSTDAEWTAPRWAWPVTFVLCILGLAAAAYLTYGHYTTTTTLACPDKGVINCAKVTTSPQSVVLGMPVADIGLGYFVVMTALCTPWAWRSDAKWVRVARLVAISAGVIMVLRLIYVELFDVNAICLYCTSVHVITLILFGVILAATELGNPEED